MLSHRGPFIFILGFMLNIFPGTDCFGALEELGSHYKTYKIIQSRFIDSLVQVRSSFEPHDCDYFLTYQF